MEFEEYKEQHFSNYAVYTTYEEEPEEEEPADDAGGDTGGDTGGGIGYQIVENNNKIG